MPPHPSPKQLALHILYSNHHQWLMTWLRKKTGCGNQAADLAQDTFLRLLLKNTTLQELATPRIFLAHIAKGLLVDYWRKQTLERNYISALEMVADGAFPSVEQQAEIIDTLVEIDAMLQTLAPKVRHAFLLAQIDGLPYQEIGQIIGVSERMVKKYMAAAIMHCVLIKRQLAG